MRRLTCHLVPRAATALLALTLGAAPVLAQPGADPGAPRAGRSLTATGQTKPPGMVAGAPMKPTNEAAMIKAQKAAEARNKAWDTKMRSTLGSICRGC
ncbi:hypothetical protein [Methylobacterium radiodurans]|uniref:Uncharacterized protein n=1 Tax=Methylobacterium radiodurans TaxID=2202828 RepID=A0A2U8VZC2_9HYPH|nr:hypothetical protein [Methylobacterium radiodurans]AWN38426.1 hypothetical protein DK427_24065 [Methylobacterium radiodurans]